MVIFINDWSMSINNIAELLISKKKRAESEEKADVIRDCAVEKQTSNPPQ